MTLRTKTALLALSLAASLFQGCMTVKPADYTTYKAHFPKSILVLPPINESTDVEATYGVYPTTAIPIAEKGYYVFPHYLVDRIFKENGLPTPADMHQAPLEKIREVFGADAVLYPTVKQYGSKYAVIVSATTVEIHARMVDTRTGKLLWEGKAAFQQSSGGGDPLAMLLSALIQQIVDSSTDAGYRVSLPANMLLVNAQGTGLLHGHRHPNYGRDK